MSSPCFTTGNLRHRGPSERLIHWRAGLSWCWERMHDTVLDYTSLLSYDWIKRRPPVRLELQRELWMGDLAEYLEIQNVTSSPRFV